MKRYKLLIENYGPNEELSGYLYEDCSEYVDSTSNTNLASSLDTNSKLRLAMIHMKLSLSDGMPVEIPGHEYLLIGSAGSAYNKQNLLLKSVTHILCLSDIVKSDYPSNFKYKRVSMKDDSSEHLMEKYSECKEFIIDAMLSGKILVHCYKGQSRSAAIICAHLIVYHGYDFDKSLELVQLARPIAKPNEHFTKTLKLL